MGTIPAPNIAELGGQIAQAPMNALAEYTRVAALKQQTDQSAAMAPLQQQQAQQQIEMQRRQMADQDALTKAMSQYDPNKNTLADIPKLVIQNHGSGQAALGAQAGLIQQRQNLAKLSDDQFAQQQRIADLTQGVHDTVSNAPPEQKQQAYQAGLQTLARAGADVTKEPLQYPGDDVFAQHLPAIRLHSAIVAEAEKDREQTTKEQQAGIQQQEANAKDWVKAGESSVVNVNPKSGDYGKIIRGTAPVDQQELQDWLGKHPGKGPSDFMAAKAALPISIQNSLLTPEAKAMAAQYYGQTGALPAGLRSPAMSAGILNQAAGAPGGAPDIAQNKMNYGAATALQKSAVAGEMGKNITAYNTAIAHANQLQQAADALDNDNPVLLNKVGNALGYQFGSDKTTNFNVIKNALSGEISKVFKGGEATDAEIKAVQEPFSAANSPGQLKGAIQNAIHLMNSKRDALQQQYQQGMKGNPNFGGGSGGGSATKTYQGHTYIQQQDGSWKLQQ